MMRFRTLSLLLCIAMRLHGVTWAEGNETEKEMKNETSKDIRRPIWNIAYMANNLDEAEEFIEQGANSIEFDVIFNEETGAPEYTYHGSPCGCSRLCTEWEYADYFLRYMRDLTSPDRAEYRKQLILLLMNAKVSGLTPERKKRAGKRLAKLLLANYWERGSSGARAYIIISVPGIEHVDFINSFIKTLKSGNNTECEEKIGFDFYEEEGDLQEIGDIVKEAEIGKNYWQGEGTSDCSKRSTERLIEILEKRDADLTFIRKSYYWTVDKESTMEDVLRLGVDGIITNKPYVLTDLLEDEEFSSKVRLATFEDSPWTNFKDTSNTFLQESRKGEEIQELSNCDCESSSSTASDGDVTVTSEGVTPEFSNKKGSDGDVTVASQGFTPVPSHSTASDSDVTPVSSNSTESDGDVTPVSSNKKGSDDDVTEMSQEVKSP